MIRSSTHYYATSSLTTRPSNTIEYVKYRAYLVVGLLLLWRNEFSGLFFSRMNGDELIVQFIPLELSTANDGSTQIPGRLLQTNPVYWVETAAVRIRSNTSNSML